MKSDFRKEELANIRGKTYPVVGGRLRLAHEERKELGIFTSVVQYDHLKLAIVSATVRASGEFSGHGVASAEKDAKFKTSLLELAETRAIARALRFAGYGIEYTGAEEIEEEPESIKRIAHKMENVENPSKLPPESLPKILENKLNKLVSKFKKGKIWLRQQMQIDNLTFYMDREQYNRLVSLIDALTDSVIEEDLKENFPKILEKEEEDAEKIEKISLEEAREQVSKLKSEDKVTKNQMMALFDSCVSGKNDKIIDFLANCFRENTLISRQQFDKWVMDVVANGSE